MSCLAWLAAQEALALKLQSTVSKILLTEESLGTRVGC
jgi:hypothetical protein